jgi:O-antigen ligase
MLRVPGGAAATPPDPLLPIAIALAVTPFAAVLQSKAVTPIALVALLATVATHRAATGVWPWPRGLPALAATLLCLWAALSAAWAIDPARALSTALLLCGFMVLGAAAARAAAVASAAGRTRLLRWGSLGLAIGLAAATLDAWTGNALRAAVRGLETVPPTLAFGLKPAASLMALWLPLVAAAPLPRPVRICLLGGGALALLALPGEAAKLAVLAGGIAAAVAAVLPRQAPRLLAATLAGMILLTPALLGPVLTRGIAAAGWPASAAHRLLIWDFAIARIAERPLFGWGMEASRTVPGRDDRPETALLARFDLAGPEVEAWLRQAPLMPLHPHNGALQLWLELGLLGAALGALLAALLALRCGGGRHPAVGCAMLASAGVTGMLSFGLWQEWWIGAQLLALVAAAAVFAAPGPDRQAPARPGDRPPGQCEKMSGSA